MATNKDNVSTKYPTPYPLIDVNPSISKIVSNFGLREVGIITVPAVVLWADTWLRMNKRFRSYQARVMGFVGFAGGFCMSMILVQFKFMGGQPNEDLVRKYGKLTDEQIEDGLRRMRDENIELINPAKKK